MLKTLEERVFSAIDEIKGTQEKRMPVDLSEQIKAFMASLKMPEKPDLPDTPGSAWKLVYTWGDSSFAWEMVEDPNAQGVQDNPILWEVGMNAKANYWYKHNEILYVCIQSGAPSDITDTEYFKPWEDNA